MSTLFRFVDYIVNSFWLCEFYHKISWLWLCQLLCKLSLTLSTLSNGVNRGHTATAGEAQPPLLKHSTWATDFGAIGRLDRTTRESISRWLIKDAVKNRNWPERHRSGGCWRKKRKTTSVKMRLEETDRLCGGCRQTKRQRQRQKKRRGKENAPGKDWVPLLDYSGGCQLLDVHGLAPAMMWKLWSLRLTFSSSCLTLFREVCHHLEKARQL